MRSALIDRDFRIHDSRPGVDAAAHGLRLLKPLMPQPSGYIHRAYSVVANYYDVIFRVQFLMGTSGDVAHRNQFRPSHVRRFKLPRLADVEQRESVTLIELPLHFFGRDLVVHVGSFISSPSSSAGAFPGKPGCLLARPCSSSAFPDKSSPPGPGPCQSGWRSSHRWPAWSLPTLPNSVCRVPLQFGRPPSPLRPRLGSDLPPPFPPPRCR